MEIICHSCQKVNNFSGEICYPVECEICFIELTCEDLSSNSNSSSVPSQVKNLILIYQVNQQKIIIPANERTTLGRKGFGEEVLSNIYNKNGQSVISRKHCSISFFDNEFSIKDEGSANGTFYSNQKLDCSESNHIIKNGDLIYLGREAFIAEIEFIEQGTIEKEGSILDEPKKNVTQNNVILYKCGECGLELSEKNDLCPDCSAWGRFYEIVK